MFNIDYIAEAESIGLIHVERRNDDGIVILLKPTAQEALDYSNTRLQNSMPSSKLKESDSFLQSETSFNIESLSSLAASFKHYMDTPAINESYSHPCPDSDSNLFTALLADFNTEKPKLE